MPLFCVLCFLQLSVIHLYFTVVVVLTLFEQGSLLICDKGL